MRGSRKSAVLAMTLLFTTTATAAGVAHAEAVTCQGQVATHVGTHGAVLAATPGPDVIVSNGATRVEAGAGDDVVCVTGGSTQVLAGDGNDSVEVQLSSGAVNAQLGSGTNTYRSAGAVNDEVSSGSHGVANHDQITLGDGTDALHWSGSLAGTSAATGVETLYLWSHRGQIHFDARTGALRSGEVPLATIEDVRATWFDAGEERATFHFQGTSAADEVRIYGASPGEISLKGGDDWLVTDAGRPNNDAGYLLSGGRGEDLLEVGSDTARRLHLDLRTKFLMVQSRNSDWGVQVSGFENAGAAARWVAITGTGKDNRLRAAACRANIRGLGGRDRIAAFVRDIDTTWAPRCHGKPRFLGWVDGGRGSDRIEGTPGPDYLDGGPGRDRIDGSGGHDTCVGEVRTSCEVRRRR